MKKLVLFASGNGSNAEEIINYFKINGTGTIAAIFTNNAEAYVIHRAKKHNIPFEIFSKDQLNNGEVLKKLDEVKPDLIVLAGFLLLFPMSILEKHSHVINIHPALLPKYGGKGMYGMRVHNAVLEAKEKETGITIHYVNENYDEGKYIFQKSVSIEACKSAEEIAQKVHELEYLYFPKVVFEILNSK